VQRAEGTDLAFGISELRQHLLAGGRLDLDDAGAVIGEDLRASAERPREVDHAQSGHRAGSSFRSSWAIVARMIVDATKHHRRFFANARPDCDLRYFSNSSALYLSGKAQYQTNFQGLNFAVCVDLPALWSDIRCFKSAVAPVYSCSGTITLRMM
jgi:hypothetical protein